MDIKDFQNKLYELRTRFEQAKPELEVTVRDPESNVEGYVVVHNTGISAGGPLALSGKGGTRITEELSLDEVKMLAMRMALKNAAAGLPLGGAKSGMRANPDSEGFEQRYKKFVTLCKPFLYEHGGIFGGFGFDIGARPTHAEWACEALESKKSFTGKPLEMGGTDYDRQGIAGYGTACAALAVIDDRGESASGKSFAVQGAGAMGSAVIRYFSEFGATLKAVSDPRLGGAWLLRDKASDALLAALSTMDFEKASPLIAAEADKMEEMEDILGCNVDVFFPCAVQDSVTHENAYMIKAPIVSEGANGGLSQDAYFLLHDRDITVVPDFIANPGGIIAAFVELTSNKDGQEKVQEAKDLTRSKITENVKLMLSLAKSLEVKTADAALYIALSRIFGEEIAA